jgi:hypothetical protein
VSGSASQRPPHQIDRNQVADWLADSIVTRVTYHATSFEAASHILEHGVDIERSRSGAYGEGFYTATEPDPFFGPAILEVAIRLQHALAGSANDVEVVIDAIARRSRPRDYGLTLYGSRAVRRELLDLGYDGIVIYDGGGDGVDYVIALDEATVKIVVDG